MLYIPCLNIKTFRDHECVDTLPYNIKKRNGKIVCITNTHTSYNRLYNIIISLLCRSLINIPWIDILYFYFQATICIMYTMYVVFTTCFVQFYSVLPEYTGWSPWFCVVLVAQYVVVCVIVINPCLFLLILEFGYPFGSSTFIRKVYFLLILTRLSQFGFDLYTSIKHQPG